MVDRLKERLIRDPRIEAAFRAVPRHMFVPGIAIETVYSGDVIPTRFNEKKQPISSSSEVAIMAVMAEQLDLAEGHRVLEIGAGTGYNAAILAQLVGEVGRVTTIDIDAEIAAEAREHLDSAGYARVRVETGDGWLGLPERAPYDRIELTASTSDLSPAWVEQLADDGILLVPLQMRTGFQLIVAFRKSGRALRSVSVRGGGFMALRGTGASGDARVHREDWSVAGAGEEDLNAIFALLKTEPRVELGPAYDPLTTWDRMSTLAAVGDEVISISYSGRGFGYGLFDRIAGSLAVASLSYLTYLGPRVTYQIYGSPSSLPAIRTLIEDGPKTCDEIEIEAEPLSSPVADGSVLRRYYRPVVRLKSGVGAKDGGVIATVNVGDMPIDKDVASG